MVATVGTSSSAAASPPLNPPTGKTGEAAGNTTFDATVASVKPQAKPPAPSQSGKSTGQSSSRSASKSSKRSGGSSATQSSGGSKSDYGNLIKGLSRDGDQFTVAVQAGAQVSLPLEEFDLPGSAGPQLQYGYDATVKQVGSGNDAQYNVTFDKNLLAGANEQAPGPLKPQLEENLLTSGTVTLTFKSKADLSRGLNALKQTVEAQSLRDFGTLENPKVALAKPSVPHQDVASLEHDGGKVLSDAGSTGGSILGGLGDLATGHFGRLGSDAKKVGGDLVHDGQDAFNTGKDAGKTVFDVGKNEVVHSLGDNATAAGNLVRNPLDQWSSGPAVKVPVDPGPGLLINAGADYAAGKVAPSAADTQFLKDHITGYAVTGGLQLRGSAQFPLPLLGNGINLGGIKAVANAIGQPRLADTGQVTLAETKPQNGKPGTVSITFANKANLDVKAVGQLALEGKGGKGVLSRLADPNVASTTGSVTLTYNLSAAQSKQLEDAGHSLSITDLVPVGKLAHPDQVTAKLDAQLALPVVDHNGHVAPGSFSHETLGDLTFTRTFNDPGQALDLLKSFPTDPTGAVTSLVRGTTVEANFYDQHGVPTQTELGGGINGVADGKVYLQQQETSEHLLAQYGSSQPTPSPRAQGPAPRPHQPAPPHDRQLVVLPDAGLNIRRSPNTEAGRLGAFTSGTFVHTSGQRAVDAQGNQWVRVSGPDSDRKSVTGWVEAKYVTPHADGGENASGRIDRSLRGSGYVPVTVRPGDTVDGIAARYGKDPEQAVAVNHGHIIEPDLIFPGDTVYLPSGPLEHS